MEIQADDDDAAEEVGQTNDKEEVHPKNKETMIELKFLHDVKTLDEFLDHIKNILKLKIIGNLWLSNYGKI